MFFWRISNYADLSGIGAEIADGRWHTAAPEKRMLYLAEHPAVALVENLASLDGDPAFFPEHFQLVRMTIPNGPTAREVTSKQLVRIDSQNLSSTQAIGDAWLAAKTSALLRVPSIPSPESWNYLLNPLHPDAAALKIDWARTITYDRRLFQLGRIKT
jgi:RES domain-containing protein